MDYQRLFGLFQARDVITLIDELQPCLGSWAKDVFNRIPADLSDDWATEIIAAGSAAMKCRVLTLLDKPIDSGKHLVNSLRKPVRKEMYRTWSKLIGRKPKTGKTFYEEVVIGEPANLLSTSELPVEIDCEFVKGVAKRSQKGIQQACLQAIIDPEPDELSNAIEEEDKRRRQQLARLVALRACELARQKGWSFVEVMLLSPTKLSEVSRYLEIPRETLRDRLKWLGREIVKTATYELDSLGKEFLGKLWILAARNPEMGHRKSRRAKTISNVPVPPAASAVPASLAAKANRHVPDENYITLSV